MGYSGTTVRKECNPQIVIFECLIVLCSFDCLLFDLREIRKYGAVNKPRTSWRPPDGTPVSRPVYSPELVRSSVRLADWCSWLRSHSHFARLRSGYSSFLGDTGSGSVPEALVRRGLTPMSILALIHAPLYPPEITFATPCSVLRWSWSSLEYRVYSHRCL